MTTDVRLQRTPNGEDGVPGLPLQRPVGVDE